MKKLTTLAAFSLVLLPTHLPQWLDMAPPLASEPLPRLSRLSGTVGRNDTISSLLSQVLDAEGVARVVSVARPLHDLAHITAGHPFGIVVAADGLLHTFTYGIDELRTLRVAHRNGQLAAELVERKYDTRTSVVAGTIDSSLFGAIEAAGERDQLALDLADIFQWDVDFNTEIQAGDSFRVLVEKQSLDGAFARYGRVLAAEFVNEGRVLRAVRHEGLGGAGYYTPDGRPLRKAFLRSPLRFNRISSRFTQSRLHPVLGIRRPHLGVDYAAPAGTPVHAAGDGVVVAAGWMGGYGRSVRLRHPNGYETLYGHLSRIAVRSGQRIAQGTLVGNVGATGLATGPHLDYRMSRNGTFIDPLRLPTLEAQPIARAERAAFDAETRQLLRQLGTSTARTASR